MACHVCTSGVIGCHCSRIELLQADNGAVWLTYLLM